MTSGILHVAFTESQRRSLLRLLQAGSLTVGEVVELPGRRITIRGFDPSGVEDRCIYFDETDRGVAYAVRVEDLQG